MFKSPQVHPYPYIQNRLQRGFAKGDSQKVREGVLPKVPHKLGAGVPQSTNPSHSQSPANFVANFQKVVVRKQAGSGGTGGTGMEDPRGKGALQQSVSKPTRSRKRPKTAPNWWRRPSETGRRWRHWRHWRGVGPPNEASQNRRAPENVRKRPPYTPVYLSCIRKWLRRGGTGGTGVEDPLGGGPPRKRLKTNAVGGCPFTTRVWPPHRGQRGRWHWARLPPVSGLPHRGQGGSLSESAFLPPFWPPHRGERGRPQWARLPPASGRTFICKTIRSFATLNSQFFLWDLMAKIRSEFSRRVRIRIRNRNGIAATAMHSDWECPRECKQKWGFATLISWMCALRGCT